MPATAPPTESAAARHLEALGLRIRAQRKRHGISATSAAEAAGLSRVTLHRIERGEPSVTMGAYMNVLGALGLELAVQLPEAQAESLPQGIALADYPQLQRLAWQRDPGDTLTPREALNFYERNWRHVDVEALTPSERALVETLTRDLAGGRLLI